MAVSGYQNPLEYQMYSAFERKEEDDTPITTTSLTETQPVAAQPEATRTSLGILQSAGLTPTERPAASILKGVGTPTAKDVLRSMYTETPDGGMLGEGITAKGILEDYRKEQELFNKQQAISNLAINAEKDLLKKEQDFIKNYRYDLPQYNPNKYETKFGSIEFDPEMVMVRAAPGSGFNKNDMVDINSSTNYDVVDPFAYHLFNVKTENFSGARPPKYVFLPQDYIIKGMAGKSSNFFNVGFLDTATWESLAKTAQAVDLSSTQFKNIDIQGQDPTANLGKGYLFTESDYRNFYTNHLEGKFRQTYGFSEGFANRTPILGIANYNGELVYARDNFKDGRTTYYNIRIDKTGTANGQWFTEAKDYGGIRGVAQDIAQGFAEIPYGPELVMIATGGVGGPALYASLKALQVAGQGGDLGDWAKAGATAYITSSVAQNLTAYGESLGNSIHLTTGIPTAVANTMGAAVVNAGFNGFVAAATGQDVGDAMLAGAISGGINANAADITNTVFGGEANVKALSSTLKLDPAQTQRIFAGALSSGAVNSVVKGMDFMDAFTESLLVQGVSQSGANIVGQNLNKTLDPKARAAITSNTRIFLQATARAAVRGEDVNEAIKKVAPYLQGRAIGQTINIATTKK